ncbi:MAG: hypothetical protein Q8R83_01055 [Legionellaceae bacterium]|nr:hypothetical protein [Legionellaceae bacterium]
MPRKKTTEDHCSNIGFVDKESSKVQVAGRRDLNRNTFFNNQPMFKKTKSFVQENPENLLGLVGISVLIIGLALVFTSGGAAVPAIAGLVMSILGVGFITGKACYAGKSMRP